MIDSDEMAEISALFQEESREHLNDVESCLLASDSDDFRSALDQFGGVADVIIFEAIKAIDANLCAERSGFAHWAFRNPPRAAVPHKEFAEVDRKGEIEPPLEPSYKRL